MIKYIATRMLGTVLIAGLFSCSQKAPSATVSTPPEIKEKIESSKSALVLVHVWATWCDPCREEFPELLKAYEAYKKQGLELLLISADDPAETDAIQAFLIEHKSATGSLIASELSQEFIETLSPEWGGALPSSFFYANGKLLVEWEGKRSYEQYAEQIETLLNK